MVLDIIIIIVASRYLTVYVERSFANFYNFVFCLAPAGFSIGWQLAEFITLGVRKDRGIYPGAHVGIHLCVWLAFMLAIINASFETYAINYGKSRSRHYYYDVGKLNVEYSFQVASLALAVFLLILHFVLFVRACVETHRRNKRTQMAFLRFAKIEQSDNQV